ncbi:hypothetical protein GCM10009789_84310 [Kribbella sancticallisti]|uniref:PH domain-containing protein n=1 Tax=Kribbella sancticallisti TaxID=460087 RepID=A0ABP4QP89_9ACTN
MADPVLRRWGRSRFIIPFVGLLLVAAVVASFFHWEFALAIVPILALLAFDRSTGVSITDTELVLHYPFSPTRIPREDVDFAVFDWGFFSGRSWLEIHRRDGTVVRYGLLQPKSTSTELSGDPPQPDSAAYQITEWARTFRP